MLPDQMAKITIRNDSLAEVYEAWITTNVNGSAPVTWDSGLEAVAGNYTIILDDLKGEKVVEHFMLLFNEETYWQVKVGLIEKELQSQYQYINFLYSFQKYQERKIKEMERRMTIFGALTFVTVMCAIYVGMHELSGAKRSTSGLMVYPGKAVELLFRSRPIVELDHEILEDVQVPKEKRVPIYGHDHFCPICDPDKTHKLTENQLRDHLWAKHDRLHLKKESFRAKWRARKAKSELASKKKESESPKLSLLSAEKAKEEWKEENIKEHFEGRLKLIKKQLKKGEITPEQAKVEIAQLKEDLQKVNLKMPEPPKTTSAKPELQRKVRMEKQLSAPVKTPAGVPCSKTAIDELFDSLKNEKVN
jgi:hypothetical protein